MDRDCLECRRQWHARATSSDAALLVGGCGWPNRRGTRRLRLSVLCTLDCVHGASRHLDARMYAVVDAAEQCDCLGERDRVACPRPALASDTLGRSARAA